MDYEIKACLRCAKLYPRVASPYCRECLELFDQEFLTVRDYIYEHADAHLDEISMETGVSEKTIIGFIREGRITLKEHVLKCNRCGRPIASGETCEQCKLELVQKINSSIPEKKQPQKTKKWDSSSKMHVLGKGDKNRK